MKKISFLLMLLMFVIALVGCQDEVHRWEFAYGYEEIRAIEIIEIVDETDYRVVREIDLSFAEELYTDIMNIEMKRYGTNLSSPCGMCFLITFDNGEYDIFSQKEPKHFKYDGENLQGYNSWLFCEESDFNALINKYMNDKL